MHYYDFRCNNCNLRFSLHYETYADYDAATPVCPYCKRYELARIISQVAVRRHKSLRDYREMSPGELNAAIRSPDSRKVGEVFRQMTESEPDVSPEFQEVTKRLLKGESMDRVDHEVAIPDQVPGGTGLARELLDLKIRHDRHHHDRERRNQKE